MQQWREQFECANPSCAGAVRLWKRVAGGVSNIRIRNGKFCFPGCFEDELRHQFAKLAYTPAAKPARPHRIPFGLLMLARGDIDGAQLRAALARQREQGNGRIGEWMWRMGFVQERQVTTAVGAQWACPVVPTSVTSVACENLVPYSMLRAFRMAPVSYIAATRIMHVAFAEGINYSVLLAIEQALGCRAEACICSSSQLNMLLEQLEEKSPRWDHEFAAGTSIAEMVRITSNYAGMLASREVRLAACYPMIWVRVEGKEDSINLIFSSRINAALAS